MTQIPVKLAPKRVAITAELLARMFVNRNSWPTTSVQSGIEDEDALTGIALDPNERNFIMYFNDADDLTPLTDIVLTSHYKPEGEK